MKARYSIYFLGLVVTGSLYAMKYNENSAIVITADDHKITSSNMQCAFSLVQEGIKRRLALEDMYENSEHFRHDVWASGWKQSINFLQQSASKKIVTKETICNFISLYNLQNDIINEFLLPTVTVFHQLSLSVWPRFAVGKKVNTHDSKSFLQFPTAPFSSEEIYQLTAMQKLFEDFVEVSKAVTNALPIDSSPFEEKEKNAEKLFYLINDTYFR